MLTWRTRHECMTAAGTFTESLSSWSWSSTTMAQRRGTNWTTGWSSTVSWCSRPDSPHCRAWWVWHRGATGHVNWPGRSCGVRQGTRLRRSARGLRRRQRGTPQVAGPASAGAACRLPCCLSRPAGGRGAVPLERSDGRLLGRFLHCLLSSLRGGGDGRHRPLRTLLGGQGLEPGRRGPARPEAGYPRGPLRYGPVDARDCHIQKGLGYLSPIEFEEKHYADQAATEQVNLKPRQPAQTS